MSKTKVAKLYLVDGTVKDIKPKNGYEFETDELMELLECEYLQVVFLDKHQFPYLVAMVDERAKIYDKPLNEAASNHYAKYYGTANHLAGNVLICSPEYVGEENPYADE